MKLPPSLSGITLLNPVIVFVRKVLTYESTQCRLIKGLFVEIFFHNILLPPTIFVFRIKMTGFNKVIPDKEGGNFLYFTVYWGVQIYERVTSFVSL
jgi:hypothetical protein